MVLTSTKITKSLNRAPERYGYHTELTSTTKKIPKEGRKSVERLDLIETSVAYCNGAFESTDLKMKH